MFNKLGPFLLYCSVFYLLTHSGWVIQKGSKWEDDINIHILYLHQAGFDVSIFNTFEKDRSVSGKNPVFDQEKLSIEHLLVAFFILESGFILA